MTKRVPRSAIVDDVASTLDVRRPTVERIVAAFLDRIAEIAMGGDMVILTGFGTFECREKPERMGTNPQTHEPIVLPPSRSLAFRASKKPASGGAA